MEQVSEGRSDGPGFGVEFTLRLPRVDPPATQAAAPEAEIDLSHVQILVVDDTEDAADTFELMLRHLGAEVRVAYDGRAGLRQFALHQPSVVFLDIGMPEMEGYQVA